MKTAKLFTNGRSQAVRLPKDFRFPGSDVYIKKFENIVILFAKDDPWASMIDSLEKFSDDFMEDRTEPEQQTREPLS